MATVRLNYDAGTDLTITLASLASDANLLAGRESTAWINSSGWKDVLLQGQITVGTSPTAGTQIVVGVVMPINDGPAWPDVFDGTDSAETVTSWGIRESIVRIAAVIAVDSATSDRAYPFTAGSVAALFGGILPERFVVFVTHNTGAALNATPGNHNIEVRPVYDTIA